jgi:predicted lysophospholipase L1 biosynthesis ABC-type transport system permease subunit
VILGETPFVAAGVIISEPDTLSLGISFTPKVIVRRADFISADIDISQSRTSYRVALRSNIGVPTEEVIATLEEYAETNKLRFDNALDGPNSFVRGLSSVESFISIIISIALFLVSVNIIANLTYILTKMQKMIAILKTF